MSLLWFSIQRHTQSVLSSSKNKKQKANFTFRLSTFMQRERERDAFTIKVNTWKFLRTQSEKNAKHFCHGQFTFLPNCNERSKTHFFVLDSLLTLFSQFLLQYIYIFLKEIISEMFLEI